MAGSDHHLALEQPYRQGNPLDIDDARRAARRASEIRRSAESDYRTAIDDRARKEATYRQKLSEAIVRLKADGEASTTASERARGEKSVEQALIDFRVAEGMVDAHKQRLIGIEGERSMLKSLIDYSARVNASLRDGFDPATGEVHGSGLRTAA